MTRVAKKGCPQAIMAWIVVAKQMAIKRAFAAPNAPDFVDKKPLKSVRTVVIVMESLGRGDP